MFQGMHGLYWIWKSSSSSPNHFCAAISPPAPSCDSALARNGSKKLNAYPFPALLLLLDVRETIKQQNRVSVLGIANTAALSLVGNDFFIIIIF